MTDELKKKAYLLGSRLLKQGHDLEVIRARMDKENIPSEVIEQVIPNLVKQVMADASKEKSPFFKIALIKIGIGVLLAIISLIVLPNYIFLPIGFIASGIAIAFLVRPTH